MRNSRRIFLKHSAVTGAALAAVSAVPQPLMALIGSKPEAAPPIDDPRLKSLVQRGVDAARAAGAQYADVRLTHTRTRDVKHNEVDDKESITVGVRALVNGYWGFAASPVWDAAEIARLGKEAAFQAKTNSLGGVRVTELAPTPVVSDGHWIMPVKIDPFSVHPSHVKDVLDGIVVFVKRKSRNCDAIWIANFFVQEKAFMSTEGTYFTQRTYRTGGGFSLKYADRKATTAGTGSLDFLTPAGVGFELFDELRMRNAVDQMIEDFKLESKLPVKPIDVGRYDTVLGASATANILSGTIGAATELDRALGFEANAGGTSYLRDPSNMVGSYPMGAPALTVTANRNDPGAVATVQWDDDGVVPQSFPLVTNGILTNYQTTREGAGWLGDSNAKRGVPTQSHGCAYAEAGVNAPLAFTANLAMQPGTETQDFDGLISHIDKGIAFKNLSINLDFQQLNGLGIGACYEVSKGRRVAWLANAGILFNTPELWKSLKEIGGNTSAQRYGLRVQKGEPAQTFFHSVTAVPCAFDKLTVIDVQRKA